MPVLSRGSGTAREHCVTMVAGRPAGVYPPAEMRKHRVAEAPGRS